MVDVFDVRLQKDCLAWQVVVVGRDVVQMSPRLAAHVVRLGDHGRVEAGGFAVSEGELCLQVHASAVGDERMVLHELELASHGFQVFFEVGQHDVD